MSIRTQCARGLLLLRPCNIVVQKMNPVLRVNGDLGPISVGVRRTYTDDWPTSVTPECVSAQDKLFTALTAKRRPHPSSLSKLFDD